MRIKWTEDAFQDLNDIEEYLIRDNPARAKVVIFRIREAINHLIRYPNQGRQGRIQGTREHIVLGSPYLIAYRLSEQTIEILRILYTRRKWPNYL